MLSPIPLVVNSVSSYSDVWPMFVGQTSKYYPETKVYFFTDRDLGFDFPDNYQVIHYKEGQVYRDQFLSCITKVPERRCIYVAEDSILYAPVDEKALLDFKITMETQDLSFIRFTRGDNYTEEIPIPSQPTLRELRKDQPFYFSLTPHIWKVGHLTEVHRQGPRYHIGRTGGPQFEPNASEVCVSLGYRGLQYYNGEPKRGSVHYDNNVFPYIATALVDGKWNTKEYQAELTPLLREYDVNTMTRGFYQ